MIGNASTPLPPDFETSSSLNADGLVRFLGRAVFGDYEPCQFEPFENRYRAWIGNLDDVFLKATMRDLVLNIFYVGRKEFEALYRSLYNGILANWVIDTDGLDVRSEELSAQIHSTIDSSWICPITDSLRINAFLKVNGLTSKEFRPDWKSLCKFGDPEKISNYVREHKISKLVLLEDFVGSGTQSKNAVEYAAKNFPELQVFFSPLVVCPAGHKKLTDLASNYPNLTYRPTMKLPEECIVSSSPKEDEPELHERLRQLTTAVHERVGGDGPLGFKNTGALVVLYSNCPNNTLSIVHEQSSNWESLFPRIKRVK